MINVEENIKAVYGTSTIRLEDDTWLRSGGAKKFENVMRALAAERDAYREVAITGCFQVVSLQSYVDKRRCTSNDVEVYVDAEAAKILSERKSKEVKI